MVQQMTDSFRQDEARSVLYYDNTTQNYGIDKPGFAAHTTFLTDLHDKGIISKDDLEGLELYNEKNFTKMLHKSSQQAGLGRSYRTLGTRRQAAS